MRIISDFHDYYDSAQQFGQDESIIYQRKTIHYLTREKNPLDPKNVVYDIPQVLCDAYEKVNIRDDKFFYSYYGGALTSFRTKEGQHNVWVGHIAFCGKVFRYVEINNNYFYTTEQVIDYMEKNYGDEPLIEWGWGKRKVKVLDKIATAFGKKIHLSEDFLIENKFICVDFCGAYITVNPNLKSLQFYKVMDAYQCYQELDSYICGKLSFPHNVMVEIEDKYKIEQHGFDKWSFRKMPTKKK